MEYKFSESANLKKPYKIEGNMLEAKKSFYELVKDRVRILNSREFSSWVDKLSGFGKTDNFKKYPAFVLCWPKYGKNRKGEFDKFLTALEIVINRDSFCIEEKDYSDIIPFVVEHEIFEIWLSTKKGFGDGKIGEEDIHRKHLLALRREFLLAEQDGLAEKVFEWRMKIDPSKEREYKDAWENAKKKIKSK